MGESSEKFTRDGNLRLNPDVKSGQAASVSKNSLRDKKETVPMYIGTGFH
jgi:hypothetical protein